MSLSSTAWSFVQSVKRDPRIVAFAVLAAATMVALVVYMSIGRFVRYVADDYCSASIVDANGWLASQSIYYDGWSGRFASTALFGASELSGAWVAAIVAPAGIALLMMAVTAALRSSGARWPASIGGASLVTFVLISVAPQQFETFYWLTGAATYLPSVILVTLAYAAGRRGWLALVALLGFFSAGFSETAGVVQGAGALVLLVLAPAHRRALLALLVGTAAGVLLVALAPGNDVRAAEHADPHLLRAGLLTLAAGVRTMGLTLGAAPFVTTMVVALPLVMAASGTGDRAAKHRFRQASVLAVTVVVATAFPAAWATSQIPPDRVLTFGVFALTGWLMVLGWAIGTEIQAIRPIPERVAAIVVLTTTILPLVTAGVLMQHRADYAEWSDGVSALERKAATSGTVRWSPTTAPPPLDVRLSYPGADPDLWINDCVARYVGVPSLTVLPE